MGKRKHHESGFAPVETLLVVVFIAMISFVGWYVLQAKRDADKNLTTANSSQTSGGTGGSDNQSLQDDLSGLNTANNQTTKDLNAANSGLDDNSSFTSLP